MKIDCTYVCVMFRKYNLIESFSIMTTMHKIKRWFIRWMIDDWMKIWFFSESLYVWIINRDFSYVFFVFSFFILFTKRALKTRMFDNTSRLLMNLKIFFLINRWFCFVLNQWIKINKTNFQLKNNLNRWLIDWNDRQSIHLRNLWKNKNLNQWQN